MSSRNKGRYVLIAALSGRALAASARRAGYAPLVADLFGDVDTRDAAFLSRVTSGDLRSGLKEPALLASLADLAGGRRCEGLVYGAGFEDRPESLTRLAEHWPLLGNTGEVVSRTKDPFAFAELCRDLGVAHPMVSVAAPSDPRNWVQKRIGGSGGAHVRAANAKRVPSERIYFQRRVAGRAVSLLFLANGMDASPLGFSAQWSEPAGESLSRYGGAVRPAGIGPRLKRRLCADTRKLSRHLGLRGLNSADFLIEGDTAWLIEINPRPGATLDLFDMPSAPLFALHVDACRGALPERAPRWRGGVAAATVYATCQIPVMPELNWPAWCSDRQSPGTRVEAGAPICTVRAKAHSASRARALAEARIRTVRAMAQGGRG
ncbi:MAG: ATP-grasp domain-containing protein [Hyphomicrobiales bacterium]|nr:ATP-grasp domain-containing protein [Hyphomicrobiales bacterium]